MPSPQMTGKQRLLALAAGQVPHSRKPAQDLRAHGGKIKGPGTPTSDSVDAKLSKGEFVLPADTTSKVGVRRLKQLVAATHQPTGKKRKPHHYADGGPVEDEQDKLRKAASAPAATAPAPAATPAPPPAEQPKTFTRDELIAKIPVDTEYEAPPRQATGMLDSLKQTEVGRQVYNTAMALPGVGGVGRAAATGGAISTGVNRLAAMANTTGNLAAGDGAAREAVTMGADYARNFPVSEAQAGTLPAGDKAAGPAVDAPAAGPSQQPPGSQAPGTPSESQVSASSAPQVAPGVYQHGRGQFSDRPSDMGFASGFTGQPSTADQQRAAAVAQTQSPVAAWAQTQQASAAGAQQTRSPVGMTVQEAQAAGLIGERVGYGPAYDQRLNPSERMGPVVGEGMDTSASSPAASKPRESWTDFANRMIAMEKGIQPSNTPQMLRPTAVHSGNDWNARQALDRLKMAANGIYRTKAEKNVAQEAYMKGLLADQAAISGQAALDVDAMKTNAGLERENMGQQGANSRAQLQETGANRREGVRIVAEMAKFDRETEEHNLRVRGMQRLDRVQTALEKAQTPEQVSSARARLLALHGRTTQEQGRWRSGNDQNGNPFLYNETTAETLTPGVSQPRAKPNEGSYVRGPDGRQYVVRNGKPELVEGGK